MYCPGVRNPLDPHTAIVNLLQNYKRGFFGHFGTEELPLDFIAREIGYSSAETEKFIDKLKEPGILHTFYEGKVLMVSLSEA